MAHSKLIRSAAIIGVVAMLASGCSLLKTKKSGEQIDPPQNVTADAAGDLKNGADSAAVENGLQLTLYAKDANGFVAPVTLNVPKSPSPAKKSLEYLVDGGPGTNLLPKGFTALLPKGTQVKSLNIIENKKLAVVDFSKEFTSYNAQDERKILEAVTWTLTGFPTVEKVQIRVDGHDLREMPVHNTPIDSELSRAFGINLDLPANINIGQATPITVYFAAQTADNYTYYVPVTRLVQRTNDLAKAAVEQLIKGPDSSKGLNSVIAPETALRQVKVSDDSKLVTVDLNDKLLGSDKKIPASAAQALVLSLTETTGASKVQIKVNGDVKVTDTDNQSYSKPVNRPVHINPTKS